MSGQQIEPKPGVKLTWVGLALTLGYLAVLAGFAKHNWQSIATLEPNEIGDMLGGCFAPLAFLWLVLGFFQQGHELRQNVIALRLQGEELRNSVEQQRALVEATREQIEFEKESLEAQKQEQDRRRRPLFRAKPAGGGSNSVIVVRDVEVENFGATCTNIRIFLQDNQKIIGSIAVNELAKGGKALFKFQTERHVNIDGFLLICEYVDLSNEEGEQRFRISDSAQEGDFFSFSFSPVEESLRSGDNEGK